MTPSPGPTPSEAPPTEQRCPCMDRPMYSNIGDPDHDGSPDECDLCSNTGVLLAAPRPVPSPVEPPPTCERSCCSGYEHDPSPVEPDRWESMRERAERILAGLHTVADNDGPMMSMARDVLSLLAALERIEGHGTAEPASSYIAREALEEPS